jgi:glycosyltransferase involved in cell wall biosynthesis
MDPEVRNRKGEAGAAFVRTYNWETESAKLIDIYKEILS